MNLGRKSLILGLLLLLIGGIRAQDREQGQDRRRELQRIREEINKYKLMVVEQEKKESSVLDVLANLDRGIDLTHKLLQSLKKEEIRKKRQIKKIEKELKETQGELNRLKSIFAKRVVNFYKYGRMRDLELLLSAKSLNQTLVWVKYQRLLTENDRRNCQNILKKKEEIENARRLLKLELIEKEKVIEEKGREEANLKNDRDKRERILADIRQDKELYRRRLAEYERAAQEILRLIAAEERQRSVTEERAIKTDFPRLKGSLMWPTQGEIVTRYGKYRHPQLKTVTENLGIDIHAPPGAKVRSVAQGKVTAITWLRGRGNVVIISHYGGYYTVYTHLAEILVGIGEEVGMGQIIGTVGESGSLKGPMLHFEIWKNTQNLNPEEWLRELRISD